MPPRVPPADPPQFVTEQPPHDLEHLLGLRALRNDMLYAACLVVVEGGQIPETPAEGIRLAAAQLLIAGSWLYSLFGAANERNGVLLEFDVLEVMDLADSHMQVYRNAAPQLNYYAQPEYFDGEDPNDPIAANESDGDYTRMEQTNK
ncbi:unnamed protein product, partial [Mesorhabditis spiculigera]